MSEEIKKCETYCPGCGQRCSCFHQEVGIGRFYDRYVFFCPSCQKTYYEDVDGGEPGEPSEKEQTFCPFCRVSCHDHVPVPDQLGLTVYHKEDLSSSSFSTNGVALAVSCPKCGAPVTCRYIGDHGSVDHYYTWRHTCTRAGCSYTEEFSNFSCGGQERDETEEEAAGQCPQCRRKASR